MTRQTGRRANPFADRDRRGIESAGDVRAQRLARSHRHSRAFARGARGGGGGYPADSGVSLASDRPARCRRSNRQARQYQERPVSGPGRHAPRHRQSDGRGQQIGSHYRAWDEFRVSRSGGGHAWTADAQGVRLSRCLRRDTQSAAAGRRPRCDDRPGPIHRATCVGGVAAGADAVFMEYTTNPHARSDAGNAPAARQARSTDFEAEAQAIVREDVPQASPRPEDVCDARARRRIFRWRKEFFRPRPPQSSHSWTASMIASNRRCGYCRLAAGA